MSVRLSIVASAAILAIAPVAAAQERKTEPNDNRRVRVLAPSQCSVDGREIECTMLRRTNLDSVLAKRAALGVHLSSTGSLRDTIGVFITRVNPKGPAETAGIVEGERIVAINGVDLRLNSADAGDSYASGLASRRLTRELRKASPGSRVNLRVWSGGRTRDVSVTAGSAADLQERGLSGSMFDGLGGGISLNGMTRYEVESFPRMRTENGGHLRFEDIPGSDVDNFRKFRDVLPKMEIEKFRDGIPKVRIERLRDGTVRL